MAVTMDPQTIVDTMTALDEATAASVFNAILQTRPELAPPVVTFAVPDLTYPPSKVLSERRSRGVIKSFSHEKGFGFISCEELQQVFGNDVFVHGKQIGNFSPGTAVTFAVVLNKDNRPQAFDLAQDFELSAQGTSMVSFSPMLALPTVPSAGNTAPEPVQALQWAVGKGAGLGHSSKAPVPLPPLQLGVGMTQPSMPFTATMPPGPSLSSLTAFAAAVGPPLPGGVAMPSIPSLAPGALGTLPSLLPKPANEASLSGLPGASMPGPGMAS